MAKERYPATAVPETEADGGPRQDAKVEVRPGQVTRITPPAPPDRMAGTEPKPSGRTEDEAYRG